jgi:hypothetical protein
MKLRALHQRHQSVFSKLVCVVRANRCADDPVAQDHDPIGDMRHL